MYKAAIKYSLGVYGQIPNTQTVEFQFDTFEEFAKNLKEITGEKYQQLTRYDIKNQEDFDWLMNRNGKVSQDCQYSDKKQHCKLEYLITKN